MHLHYMFHGLRNTSVLQLTWQATQCCCNTGYVHSRMIKCYITSLMFPGTLWTRLCCCLTDMFGSTHQSNICNYRTDTAVQTCFYGYKKFRLILCIPNMFAKQRQMSSQRLYGELTISVKNISIFFDRTIIQELKSHKQGDYYKWWKQFLICLSAEDLQ